MDRIFEGLGRMGIPSPLMCKGELKGGRSRSTHAADENPLVFPL